MSATPRQVARVLIVDDSIVARRILTKAIESDDALEVAGVAGNGRIGLEQISAARPDVVVLDLEMPEMDGPAMLKALRATDATLPVIVFSQVSERGAQATLDALSLGASGFALKPSTQGDLTEESIRDDLLPLIKALARRNCRPAPQASMPAATTRRAGRVTPAAIVIAVSTGGPQALATLVAALPRDLPVPMLIVQHMPAMFTEMLAARLDGLGTVRVSEAQDGELVQPGHAYLAPGGRHMEVRRTPAGIHVSLNDGPRENSCRPSADVLFRSAAAAFGARLLAVVLTGMGSDGLRGCEAVVAAGGRVLVQDRESSVIGSMPGGVAAAGLADAELPMAAIGPELGRRVAGTVAGPGA
jgi:two-component system chemotaxis response regulator CheB